MSAPTEARADAGYTLVELLVAMMITSLVLVMAGTFYANIAKLTTVAKADRTATAQVSLALDAVRNAVTTASDNPASATQTDPAVVAGSTTSLTVTSYSGTVANAVAPSQFTFSVDANGFLTETRRAGVLASTGYWSFTGATVSRRVGGPFLATGTSFFSYLDRAGAELPLTAGALTTANRNAVAFVRVTAKVAKTATSGAADPVVGTTVVGLTNVFREIDGSTTLPTLTGGV